MRPSVWRTEARRRIADLVLEGGGTLRLAGVELARHVERSCPWEVGSWGHRVWQQERRRIAGRLRRARSGSPREYAGVLSLT